MGMDLITVAYTSTERGIDADAAKTIISTLTAEEIQAIDRLADLSWLGTDGDEEVLDLLRAGADVAGNLDDLRLAVTYKIGDTDRWFYLAGGGSWGDDPFDGYTALCAFLCACETVPRLAEACDFLGGGITV